MRKGMDVGSHILSGNGVNGSIGEGWAYKQIVGCCRVVIAGKFDRPDTGLYAPLAIQHITCDRAAYTAVAVEVVDEC